MICQLWWQLEISCLTSPSLKLNSRSEGWLSVTQHSHICFILQWKSIYMIGWSAMKTFNVFAPKVHMRRTLQGFLPDSRSCVSSQLLWSERLRGGPEETDCACDPYLWLNICFLNWKPRVSSTVQMLPLLWNIKRQQSPLLWISKTCWFPAWTGLSGPPGCVA